MGNGFVKRYEYKPERRKQLKRLYRVAFKLRKIKADKKNYVDYYFDSPVEEKSILISGLGRSVRGSMQYLLNELNTNDEFKDYTIYVRTQKDLTEDTVRGYIEKNGWTRTRTLPKGLTKKLETCKYLITESYLPYGWIKKQGQVMIDLWHGTPLKRLGLLKNGDKCHRISIHHKNFLCADYLLYPNDFTREIMWDSYRITSLISAKGLMMGYPRTSGILKVSEEEKADLRKQLAPGGGSIFIYMPTFRGNLSDEEAVKRESEFLDYLDKNLKDDQFLYVNLHHHIKEGIDYSKYKHIQAFPPLIDSYKMLAATDTLISDYSSVFFDFLVTRKQIILFIEDIESYLSMQGLNIDIEELPFDLARSKEQVVEMLNRGKQYDDSEIFNMMCAHDAADNPERFCQLFRDNEEGLTLIDIPDNSKKKILLYSQGCVAGRDNDRLRSVTEKYDKDKSEIYVGVDEYVTSDNMDGAYPMLHNTLLLGTRDVESASSIGKTIRRIYLKGKLPFSSVIGYLQDEYALIPKRMFGETHFDIVGVYDTVNPETLIGLMLADADKKILFISDRIAGEIRKDNRFMKDAVAYAASYCDIIAIGDESYRKMMQGILSRRNLKKVCNAGSADDILRLLDA